MADELSCALLDQREQCTSNSPTAMETAPGVFRFLAVGSVAECMEYLYQRAVENRGAVQRTGEMVTALKKELYRRVSLEGKMFAFPSGKRRRNQLT